MQFDDLRIVIDDMFSVVEDHFHNFNFMSEILLEVKEFARHDLVQFKSTIDGHKKLESWLEKRNHELESEKNLLTTQSVDQQKQIQELMSKLDNLEKSTTQQVLQHDLEKDGLLCQILNLQKEVSCLSSSSLTREKESLRKELDKTKTKLKDAESKLKNTIQDKIKLESERAQAEREIKHLHSQRAILERDMLKRESLIDKRHETKSSDYSKTKGAVGGPEQTLQEDYQKLEVHAFEMEAEVASLNEAYINAIRHMEEVFARNGILESELEDMSTKLNVTDSEILLLKEELTSNMQKLEASESFCKKLESTISLLSREKEEMAMQLTDALLEVEAEKSTWLAKEKTFTESNERLMIFNDEIDRLSNDLSEARNELDSCREQCRLLKESLSQSEEIAEREKEYNTSKSLEIAQLRNGLQQYMVSSVQNGDVKSKSEELLSEGHHGCEDVKKLQEQLIILTQQKDNLSEQVKKISTESDLPDDYQNLKSQLLITTGEKDDLLRKNKDMKTVLAELNIPKKKYEDMLSAARINVEEMAKQISNMEAKMHDEALHKDKETAKLRMRVRSMQAKLDAFRGRYEKAVDEITLMNKKFEEASGKLKKQLGSYGVEILRLKKELASKE